MLGFCEGIGYPPESHIVVVGSIKYSSNYIYWVDVGGINIIFFLASGQVVSFRDYDYDYDY